MTLSPKAKGKQRAPDPEEDPLISDPLPREVIIRFTEGVPDLSLYIADQETVRDVKASIRDARPEVQDRRIRLIHSGRLLVDNIILSLLTDKHSSNDGDTSDDTIWLHCSVGPRMEAGVDDDTLQTAQLRPARGFDRLASMGFSESDIRNFRRQFHNQSSTNYLDVDFDTEEEYEEHARSLEERWIDSMDSPASASLSLSPTAIAHQQTVIQGVLIGFFFPIIPIFFMRKGPPEAVFWEDGSEWEGGASVVFSRPMQMGIVVGFFVNVILGVWRFLLEGA